MSFNLTLSYLRDAVIEDLGDVAALVGSGFVDRAINEGQRRLQPDILLAKTLTGVAIAQDATTYTLPTDLIEITRFVGSDDNASDLPGYLQHGATIYFAYPVASDWAGVLHYRASYPDITETVDCQLPSGAADALISFALYKSFRRFAANRAEYRKFATIVGNGVTMADLENTAEAHLQDFADAAAAATTLPAPLTSWGD